MSTLIARHLHLTSTLKITGQRTTSQCTKRCLPTPRQNRPSGDLVPDGGHLTQSSTKGKVHIRRKKMSRRKLMRAERPSRAHHRSELPAPNAQRRRMRDGPTFQPASHTGTGIRQRSRSRCWVASLTPTLSASGSTTGPSTTTERQLRCPRWLASSGFCSFSWPAKSSAPRHALRSCAGRRTATLSRTFSRVATGCGYASRSCWGCARST